MSFSLCDEIKLISLVAGHPCLYDIAVPAYKSGGTRTKAWTQVASQLNKPADACRSVWTNLRRIYTVERTIRKRDKTADDAAWKCKHSELLSSLLDSQSTENNKPTTGNIYSEVNNSPADIKSPVLEHVYSAADNSPADDKLPNLEFDVQQNSSRIEWVDCDLNVVDAPQKRVSVQDPLQLKPSADVGESVQGNGGEEESTAGGEQCNQTSSAADEKNSTADIGNSFKGVLAADGEDQGLIADGGQKSSTADKEQYFEEISTADDLSQFTGKRSSKRVKQKIAIPQGKVDGDIVDEILRQEKRLLQIYRQQNNSKKRRVESKKEPCVVINDLMSKKSAEGSNTRSKTTGNQNSSLSSKGVGSGAQNNKSGAKQLQNKKKLQNLKSVEERSKNSASNSSNHGLRSGLNNSEQIQSYNNGQTLQTQQLYNNEQNPQVQPSYNNGQTQQQLYNNGKSPQQLHSNRQTSQQLPNNGQTQQQSYNNGQQNPQPFNAQSPQMQQSYSNGQSSQMQALCNGTFDDVDLFCHYISAVLHNLPPLQKAVAKKDLNSVLSHYEIVAAKNAAASVGDAQPRVGGMEGGGGSSLGWDVVSSTRMEGVSLMGGTTRLGFLGGHI